MGIKLNLGASPLWSMDGWHTLDEMGISYPDVKL